MPQGLTLEELQAKGATPVKRTGGFTLEQLQSKDSTRGNQFNKEKPTSFLGKARDLTTSFIGGGKLAEGIGMLGASRGINKSQEKGRAVRGKQATELIKRIREKKAKGEDTSRLEKALKALGQGSRDSADVSKDFSEALPTSKEVIGSGLRLGATFAGGKLASTAGKASAPKRPAK